MSTILEEIKAQIVSLKTDRRSIQHRDRPRNLRRRRQNRRPLRCRAQRNARVPRRHHWHRAQSRGNGSRRHHHRRFLQDQGRRRRPHHGQAPAGPGRQGPSRPRGGCARQTDRRQGRNQDRHFLSGGKTRSRHHLPQVGFAADSDRHHGHRRDDPHRSRPARVDHRRPRHGQDHHRHRRHHQPGSHQPRQRRKTRLPSALQHLRRGRAEERQRRARHRHPQLDRGDALHHRRFCDRLRFRHQPVSRTVRRLRDGRMVHG